MEAKQSAAPISLIRDEIRAISAYPVADASGFIKLDAMENPFRLPDALAHELGARLSAVALNRYPPADPKKFKERLGKAIGLPAGASLMLGNGSDELIHLVIQATAKPGAVVLAPTPGFVMVEMSSIFDGARYVGVPLTVKFALDVAAMLAAIDKHRPAVIFIAYPNNPTGNLFARADIDRVLDAAPGLVVLDEAYLPFAQDTFLPELSTRPNLLVMRTFSKLGLAGIRLGYMAGAPELIAEFDKVRPPYNVNVLTLAAADFLLDHLGLLDAQAAALRAERARLLTSLQSLAGVTAFPSSANFILLRVANPDAVFAGLKERGILIKNMSRFSPLLAGCLRTTVGTAEENDAFLKALSEALHATQRTQKVSA